MIDINRIMPFDERNHEDFANESIIINSSDSHFILRDGDKIHVSEIYDVSQAVFISGKVKNPGQFPYIPGMTILDLMERAGGLNDESFVQQMDL